MSDDDRTDSDVLKDISAQLDTIIEVVTDLRDAMVQSNHDLVTGLLSLQQLDAKDMQ